MHSAAFCQGIRNPKSEKRNLSAFRPAHLNLLPKSILITARTRGSSDKVTLIRGGRNKSNTLAVGPLWWGTCTDDFLTKQISSRDHSAIILLQISRRIRIWCHEMAPTAICGIFQGELKSKDSKKTRVGIPIHLSEFESQKPAPGSKPAQPRWWRCWHFDPRHQEEESYCSVGKKRKA